MLYLPLISYSCWDVIPPLLTLVGKQHNLVMKKLSLWSSEVKLFWSQTYPPSSEGPSGLHWPPRYDEEGWANCWRVTLLMTADDFKHLWLVINKVNFKLKYWQRVESTPPVSFIPIVRLVLWPKKFLKDKYPSQVRVRKTRLQIKVIKIRSFKYPKRKKLFR